MMGYRQVVCVFAFHFTIPSPYYLHSSLPSDDGRPGFTQTPTLAFAPAGDTRQYTAAI